MMKYKLQFSLIVLICLIAGLAVFHGKKRQIETTIPVFEGDSSLYFVVQDIFGISSVYIWDQGVKEPRLLIWHSGKIMDVLITTSSEKYLCYQLVRGDKSSIKKLKIETKELSDVGEFLGFSVWLSELLGDNKLLVSYAHWVDTHSFFVGRTLGSWRLAFLNMGTGKVDDFLEKDSIIGSPKWIRGTDRILFRYRDVFKKDPREFKIYNMKTKEERFLPIEIYVDQWCYDDNAKKIYFQGEGFVWKFDLESEKTTNLFELKEKIDFLVRHPVEEKFLIKFSDNPKTLFYVDKRGVVSEAFSI